MAEAKTEPLQGLIGNGITVPFRRGPSDFVSAADVDQLRSMVINVLGTRVGELPWRSAFGSLLYQLRHRNNDAVTGELARVHATDALARWVPQVDLTDVATVAEEGSDGENNVRAVRVIFDITGIHQPGNRVLVPDVDALVDLSGV